MKTEQSENLQYITLDIFSPERRLVEGAQIEELTLVSSEGQIQILPGHAAMMGSLHPGIFEYKESSKDSVQGFIATGFFEVSNNRISLMAETLELREEVDTLRAQAAQKEAQKTLSEANLDDARLRKYQLKLQRALIRQQLSSLKN